jgi:hypothetical protein
MYAQERSDLSGGFECEGVSRRADGKTCDVIA